MKRTLALERQRAIEAGEVDLLPSTFLRRVMADEAAPLAARIISAGKVLPFVELRKVPPSLEEIPIMRNWSEAQLEGFQRRTLEDMRRDPTYYGRAAFATIGEPWPGEAHSGKRPDDRWFAELSSERDYRKGGTGKPWPPGERERILGEDSQQPKANGKDHSP